jgi:hypothetical protein
MAEANESTSGPPPREWWLTKLAIAYIIGGIPVEKNWSLEMLRLTERGEITLGELIGYRSLPSRGRRKPHGPKESIPDSDFHSDMVSLPVTPLRLPKVTVKVDGTIGTYPQELQGHYRGPPWSAIEVDAAELRRLASKPLLELESAPPTESGQSPQIELALPSANTAITEAPKAPEPSHAGPAEQPTYTQILERERTEAGTPPPDPAALADRIRRELSAIDTHFKSGCLLQDLVFKHLFVAAQLDKVDLPKVELTGLIIKVISNARGYALTGPPLDDPLGPERPIPLATLPRFMYRAWDRMRVWRIAAETPVTEAESKATSTDAEQQDQLKDSATTEPEINLVGRPSQRLQSVDEAVSILKIRRLKDEPYKLKSLAREIEKRVNQSDYTIKMYSWGALHVHKEARRRLKTGKDIPLTVTMFAGELHT